MPRPRSKRNAWMPAGVYLLRGKYVLRRDGSQITLAPGSASQRDVLAAFVEATRTAAPELTLSGLIDEYTGSDRFRLKLARRTQADCLHALDKIRTTATKAGGVFGDVPARTISVVTVRKYMDKRGGESETRADRELAYLSACFGWARQRGLVDINPCDGVSRFNPPARTRYVTHEEFSQRYWLAGERGRQDLQACMWLAYLCRLRVGEILRLRDTDVRDDGLLARRAKGSKTQVIEWSDTLREAIALARSVPRRTTTPLLIISPESGLPLTPAAFSTAWQRLKVQAQAAGQAIDWTFHDLKAKGVTDAQGDKRLASGHKSLAMTERYDRLPGKAPATR